MKTQRGLCVKNNCICTQISFISSLFGCNVACNEVNQNSEAIPLDDRKMMSCMLEMYH